MSHTQTYENAVAFRERDRLLEYLFRDGLTVPEIASKTDLSQSYVWTRLNAAGYKTSVNDPRSLWVLPEDERRQAFARRAAKGAREALKQISKSAQLRHGGGAMRKAHNPHCPQSSPISLTSVNQRPGRPRLLGN